MKRGIKKLPEDIKKDEIEKLEKIVSNIPVSQDQIKDVIQRIKRPSYQNLPTTLHKFSSKSVTAVLLGDLHLNAYESFTKEKLCDTKRLKEVLHIAKEEGAQYAIQTGDVTDGEGMRSWQHRNLVVSGFYNVRDYCVNEWPESGLTTYFIGGNHDQTYLYKPVLDSEVYELLKKKKPEIVDELLEHIASQKYPDMVEDVCDHIARKRSDLVYLGMNEGNLPLQPEYIKKFLNGEKLPKVGPTWIRIRHPAKGTAKAQSYQPQSHIEATQSEFKPNILVIGHYHKMDYLFERNIHCFQAGTFERQSDWMRTKDLAAHLGAWLVEFSYKEDGTIDGVEKRKLLYEVNGKEVWGKKNNYGEIGVTGD